MHRRGSWLLGVMLVGACQPTVTPPPRPSARPSPVPATTTAPTATPASLDPAASAPAPGLVKPGDATRTITATLVIDAGYATTVAAGRMLDGTLAVGPLGASLVGNHGASAISTTAGAIPSNGGAGILGNNGGSVFGGPAVWRLLAEPAAPALGTLAPVAGMAVRVYDPADGTALALGQDASGQPVYEVLTGAGGRFEVYPPAARAGNVVVAATVPGNDDGRLQYHLVAPTVALADALDEDTSRTSLTLQRGLARSFWIMSDPAPNPADATVDFSEDPTEIAAVTRGRQALKAEAGKLHLDRLSKADHLKLAGRMADAVLARVDVASARLVKKPGPLAYDGPDERAFDALVAVLRATREAVTARMRELAAGGEDPFAWFAARDYVVTAGSRRGQPYQFKRPVDVVDFMLEAFIADPTLTPNESAGGLLQLTADIHLDATSIKRFFAAELGIARTNSRLLFQSDGSLAATELALMRVAAP